MTNAAAIIYQSVTGRWCFKTMQSDGRYRASNGHWASRAYAAKVARENGFAVEFEGAL
jgi:hypothetical protein